MITRSALCVALLLVATIAGCRGPFVLLPGGALEGPIAPAPDDWAFTDAVDTVQLETRPSDPYSVNIWAIGLGEYVYVHAGANRSTWVRNIEADPKVRLRVNDSIYELVAARVEGQDEFDRFGDAYEKKYGRRPRNENVAEAYLFRLAGRARDPRVSGTHGHPRRKDAASMTSLARPRGARRRSRSSSSSTRTRISTARDWPARASTLPRGALLRARGRVRVHRLVLQPEVRVRVSRPRRAGCTSRGSSSTRRPAARSRRTSSSRTRSSSRSGRSSTGRDAVCARVDLLRDESLHELRLRDGALSRRAGAAAALEREAAVSATAPNRRPSNESSASSSTARYLADVPVLRARRQQFTLRLQWNRSTLARDVSQPRAGRVRSEPQ